MASSSRIRQVVKLSGVAAKYKDVMTARFSESTKPDYWDEALRHLMRRDRILRRLIPSQSDVWLKPPPSPFVTLARTIISQQLSISAAHDMWQRFIDACETPKP